MNKQTIALVTTFLAVLIVSGLVSYFLFGRTEQPRLSTAAPRPAATAATQNDGGGSPPATASQSNHGSQSLLYRLFGPEEASPAPFEHASWTATIARISLRFSLAAVLAMLLAFRPRRRVPIIQRNPYVAQTQILLAVVASAMMMIVGDSAARAFGIFAAASLINFRTNIRDPKEITVLLICLAVGLATGVGRWEVAVILSLFVLLTLWILEYFELAQVFRSMEVSVATRNVDRTHEVLKQVFARHRFSSELRELNREDQEDPMGKIVYCVNLNPATSTDRLSEEILSADSQNIDSVEWDQKDSRTYLYR